MEIKKLTDIVEELDVCGQACDDDCSDWTGNRASSPWGCTVEFSAAGWSGW